MKNADKPINPVMMQQVGENKFRASKPSDPKEWNIPTEGLTKREYFAGLAMQGLISSCDWNFTTFNKDLIDATSKNAIDLADELLKQLENEQ